MLVLCRRQKTPGIEFFNQLRREPQGVDMTSCVVDRGFLATGRCLSHQEERLSCMEVAEALVEEDA